MCTKIDLGKHNMRLYEISGVIKGCEGILAGGTEKSKRLAKEAAYDCIKRIIDSWKLEVENDESKEH